ncbi:hypothetical protein [Sphingobacterium sp. UBA5996]|uniref:hypothetical protein n=1 Tax=Sphingobacterium sp. UBA5996 TaxID=1947505 RepID=UPI0025D67031|nr:hypothetical protein [Sphingobacterium sp. UBA5996]
MNELKITREKYEPPRVTSMALEMEYSIASASVTVTPGSGSNSNPLITEEVTETNHQDWNFLD